MIVPKLLSFITIAACLCQSISAMQTFHTAPVIHTTGGVPSSRTQIGIFADFKHPFPNNAGRHFPGPEEIPSANHLTTFPHEAFPQKEDLQKLAAQQALWINYDSLKPLSTRPRLTSDWLECAAIYKKLSPTDKDNLEAWLKTNVIREEPSKAMFSERINWYLLSSDETIRWAETHLKDANLITNEDIDLARIGEILQLPIQQRGLQFVYRNPEITASELHNVFFKPNRAPSQTLRLSLLEQIHDNKGTSLYKASMTTLTNSLWQMIPKMSNDQAKRSFMEVLFSACGEAPVNAVKNARTALKKMRKNPALWTHLPHGTWDEIKASLHSWEQPFETA